MESMISISEANQDETNAKEKCKENYSNAIESPTLLLENQSENFGSIRFSEIFGFGKSSSYPKFWRNVTKRRKENEKTVGSDQEFDQSENCLTNYKFEHNTDHLCEENNERKLFYCCQDQDTKVKNDIDAMELKFTDWRFGPAKLWYDMINLPETTINFFDYGFELSHAKDDKMELHEDISIDAFLMVSQLTWENNIVWNGDDIKEEIMQKLNNANNNTGWILSSENETAGLFHQSTKGTYNSRQLNISLATSKITVPLHLQSENKKMTNHTQQQHQNNVFYSIFPVENEELVYGIWEEEIIWNVKQMKKIPKPKIPTIDLNDENIIFGIPDDVDDASLKRNGETLATTNLKKSKLLLDKAGIIKVIKNDETALQRVSYNKDPFNISNDIYYTQISSKNTSKLNFGAGNRILHSIPVVQLQAPYIPTFIGPIGLRNFHRLPLKKYKVGPLSQSDFQRVLSLTLYIKNKAKEKEQERIASGGGDIFFMKSHEDITGRDGELVLIEFSEEHPPLMNQVGMCSIIKNYYKRKATKNQSPPMYKFGETTFAHTSPFLGVMSPGQSIQAIENNMYRAPIYKHTVAKTDFLIVRTRYNYYIREIDALFVAGQQCPLIEVPEPNSKRVNAFLRDFLQVFIFRLFSKSKDYPKKIKIDDIKKAFPTQNECNIRKRLKLCADFKKTGLDSNYWVMKSGFQLPMEEDIRSMISPEQCCAYYSMMASLQRLKDAGYGEKLMFVAPDEDDEEVHLKMEDEIKAAPWNTTRAYIQAVEGKSLLQLSGPADPTGCGEGFSYVRASNKSNIDKDEQETLQTKRLVTGTDADLRRLSLNNARAILRKCGLQDKDIKKLTRWEVIDAVRTLSTEKAKAGEESMIKFSRHNRLSSEENQKKHKKECQRIFDLQNHVLASDEILSSDENESSEENDSDIEEMGKNIENLLSNQKTSSQICFEQEERERQELKKMMLSNISHEKTEKNDKLNLSKNRVLKIYRTFCDAFGRETSYVQCVRNPAVIDAYVNIRNSMDDTSIKQFITFDKNKNEQLKREKRRIQDKLRRIERNQNQKNLIQKSSNNACKDKSLQNSSDFSSSTQSVTPNSNFKCNICDNFGHMETDKVCPSYKIKAGNINQSGSKTKNDLQNQDFVNVDGTKINLSLKLIKQQSKVLQNDTKDSQTSRKRKCSISNDYSKSYKRPARINRCKTDPHVFLSILEDIIVEMRNLPDVQSFLSPVNTKLVTNYLHIVAKPMDLHTIQINIKQKKYKNRSEFLVDINQIVENSRLYYGPNHFYSKVAKKLLEFCCNKMVQNDDKLMLLEQAINPLLDDQNQKKLLLILKSCLEMLKNMSEAFYFLHPVNEKLSKNYFKIVKKPMDLQTISNNITDQVYCSKAEFMEDVQLILDNCILFNKKSNLIKKAQKLVDAAKEFLSKYDIELTQIEKKIVHTKKRAFVQAGIDVNESIKDTCSKKNTNAGAKSTNGQINKQGSKSMLDCEINCFVNNEENKHDNNQIYLSKNSILEIDLQFSSDNSE